MYSNEHSDEELVRLSLKDKHAFAGLVERYERQLSVYIRRLGVGNAADCEDVLQDTFLKVYVNLNSFKTDLLFSSWVYRIAHNEAMSFFRKRKVRPHGNLVEDSEEVFRTLASELNLTDELMRKEDSKILQEVLRTLIPEYQEILILKFYEHKNYDEISDILSLPLGTVGTRLHRAKKYLKQALERNHYEYGI